MFNLTKVNSQGTKVKIVKRKCFKVCISWVIPIKYTWYLSIKSSLSAPMLLMFFLYLVMWMSVSIIRHHSGSTGCPVSSVYILSSHSLLWCHHLFNRIFGLDIFSHILPVFVSWTLHSWLNTISPYWKYYILFLSLCFLYFYHSNAAFHQSFFNILSSNIIVHNAQPSELIVQHLCIIYSHISYLSICFIINPIYTFIHMFIHTNTSSINQTNKTVTLILPIKETNLCP